MKRLLFASIVAIAGLFAVQTNTHSLADIGPCGTCRAHMMHVAVGR